MFLARLVEIGLNARLTTQSANSPDVNIEDLGFFAAIQNLHYDECCENPTQLIASVLKAFDGYSRIKINHIWLTLQGCLNEIIKIDGCNHYKIPHMNKESLERTNTLPDVLSVTEQAERHLENGAAIYLFNLNLIVSFNLMFSRCNKLLFCSERFILEARMAMVDHMNGTHENLKSVF